MRRRNRASVVVGRHLAAEFRPRRQICRRLEVIEEAVADGDDLELGHPAGHRAELVGDDNFIPARLGGTGG
jgi:hypothetical protein